MARSAREILREARNSARPESYCPDRGDLIWLEFDPQAGREQAGKRPALVLSPRKYNEVARLCVLCPITSQVKGYPFEVELPKGGNVTGAVLTDQIKSLSWVERNSEHIGSVAEGVLDDAIAKIRALLGL